jgi:hypothetical protein
MAGNTWPSTQYAWPWWLAWPDQTSRSGNASSSFVQPILPGWNFGTVYNVTTQNSSAPEVEARIVAAHSYGRQIGRIIDALAVVIADMPEEKRAANTKAIEKFEELYRDVHEIKDGTYEKWSEHVVSRLDDLKAKDPHQYERVAARLGKALRSNT